MTRLHGLWPNSLVACVLLAGCFDEGGDTARTEAASVLADSLLSFADIQANLTTDPAAAGSALARFVKTPIAANNLIAQPFDLSNLDAAARRVGGVSNLGVPDCLATSGPAGCDRFDTNPGATCEAGSFTFTGFGSRTCGPDCTTPDVLGLCDYAWDLELGFSAPPLGIDMVTTGTQSVSAQQLTADLVFDFTMQNNALMVTGTLRVCSCGSATVDPGPPRRLVNSQFVVKDVVPPGLPQRCARVELDGQGTPSIVDACSCADGTTCAN